jgi:hypothetical protein
LNKLATVGPVYHATRSRFESFDPGDQLGIHFGTEEAAQDRFSAIGGSEIEYAIDGDKDGFWVFDDQGSDGVGPFRSKSEAAAYIKAQPQAFEPLAAMLHLNKVIQLPDDFGQWKFNGIGTWLLHQGYITQAEYEMAWGQYQQEKALRELLVSKGYDGMAYENQVEGIGSTSYLVLDPSKIQTIK